MANDAAEAQPEISPRTKGRSALKRRAIIEAATTLFLANGYDGTSMDEIASMAAVSKQTVYKNFADKQQLFSDVVVGVAARAEEFIAVMRKVLHETDDLKAALRVLGQRYLLTVVQPRGLQLRRLIIAEADRFPKLARAYYERAPERTLTELATLLQSLSEKGFLRIQDPEIAANHLAYLILGQILDKAMFLGNEYAPTTEELERHTDAAIGAFLAAYGA